MGFTESEKREMTETDIRSKFIMPALVKAHWHQDQIREEVYFTSGRYIFTAGSKKPKRQEGKKADYLLSYTANCKIAIVEAKDYNHSRGAGLAQAKEYAAILNIPFAYSTNGDGFVEYDFLTGIERTFSNDEFPSPDELWKRIQREKALTHEQLNIIQQPYYVDVNKPIEPRYYQEIAINKTIEAVARGQQRILLVMATGTGKTYTAFQIIHRLKSVGAKKRILFLADRNILVDQPMREDFKPFQKTMTKVTNKTLDSAYEVYMALYQQLDGSGDDQLFKQFQPSFFDLIVVDECHRGSAKEDSAWHEILQYFNQATHIGMTATPKETLDASNITYFGEPIYTYSLKQGIEDGFLAPYRVIRVNLDCDLGWRPPKGFTDINGQLVEDRFYYAKDFDHSLISTERTELVAKRITDFLKQTDRNSKTIVFCVDIRHAERMCRALAKFNADMLQQNYKYITQITGDQMGKQADLEAFCEIENEQNHPVIAVTSKLMTTGVNSQTCKLVVLDTNIGSMTEFKQIIGRGTRLRPDADKTFFTIMDFRDVTNLFADPTFDGEPVVVLNVYNDMEINLDNLALTGSDEEERKAADNTEMSIRESKATYIIDCGIGSQILREQEQYLNEKGELITESFNTFSQQVVKETYPTFDLFRHALAENMQKFSLSWLEKLREVNHIPMEIDDSDLIAKVIYQQPTKQERFEHLNHRGYFEQFSAEQREILHLIVKEHIRTSIELSKTNLLNSPTFHQFGGLVSVIKQHFGSKEHYLNTMHDLERNLYAE